MPRRLAVLCFVTLGLIPVTGWTADRQAVQIERIGDQPTRDIILAPSLITADTCYVSENQEITTRIGGWVVGFELYKSLMIPANDCDHAYPFTVVAVNMPMYFAAATPLVVASDVEAVDSTSVPGCTVPGVVLGVSSEWETSIPEAGVYNIWVPLDEPVVVDGPFFAGFYIGNAIDPAVDASVLIDEHPVACATFNIWDEEIGWIDLTNNSYFNFPGRLAMEVSGIPAGPALPPNLEVLSPADGEVLLGQTELWAWDRDMTGRSDHVTFEFSGGSSYIEIGTVFDGSSPLRNGVDPAGEGNGYSLNWDFSSLPEGFYDLRTTLTDIDGGTTTDSRTVYLEPTPPVAEITAPADGEPFCAPVEVFFSTSDENLSSIELFQRNASPFYSVGVRSFAQATVGDNNGDENDGNSAANGEFGDYYSAPVAASMAISVWADRGYTRLITDNAYQFSQQEVAEILADAFETRSQLGTYDEAVYSGLGNYLTTHGGGFELTMKRRPGYYDLRNSVEGDEKAVMLAIGGDPGLWVVVDGFSGWQQVSGSHQVSVANPLNGSIQIVSWRDQNMHGEINLFGYWQPVDLMIETLAADWDVTRELIGADNSGADGWSVYWTPDGLTELSYHYLRTLAQDQTGYAGDYQVVAQQDCASVYVPGDYDNNRETTISDLLILIDFIANDGPAPYGGPARADCNCDNVINVADAIYYMNYLYGSASAPCR